MKNKKVIIQPVILLDENLSYGFCPECHEKLSANFIKDLQSIEIVKNILKDLPPEDTQEAIFELNDGTLLLFLCDNCAPGIAVDD